LLELIRRTPNGREVHRYCRGLLDLPPGKLPSVTRAWAFLIAGNICRYGLHPGITRTWSTDCKSSRRLLALPTWIPTFRTSPFHFARISLRWEDHW
jgi:hypothetical protein